MNHPGSGRLVLSTLLYLAIAAAVSIHCYRSAVLGIDVLGYAGTVALTDSGDVVKAHNAVYGAHLTPHLRGTDENTPQSLDMRHRAADSYAAAIHFPYFAIKPLYVLTLEGIHRLGLSVVDSCRAGSALFFFGIAAMLWFYTRSWLAVIVMILPETLLLGEIQDPDGMSCFLILLGLWLVFFKGRDIGVLPLLLVIWVRPENALLSVLVTLVLLLIGRLDWKKAAVLIALSVASDLVINHYGYPWEELYGHLMGGAPGAGVTPALSRILGSLLTALNAAFHSVLPLYGLLWIVCFPFVKEEVRWMMGVTLTFSAARFAIFPIYEARYFGLFFLTTAIAAVLSVPKGAYRDITARIAANLRELTSNRYAAPVGRSPSHRPPHQTPVETQAAD